MSIPRYTLTYWHPKHSHTRQTMRCRNMAVAISWSRYYENQGWTTEVAEDN
jgi:hypothetical protein